MAAQHPSHPYEHFVRDALNQGVEYSARHGGPPRRRGATIAAHTAYRSMLHRKYDPTRTRDPAISRAAAPGGLDHAPGRSRVPLEVLGRPARARDELAAAVRAAAAERLARAVATEGALERADQRVGRVGRQVAAAAL